MTPAPSPARRCRSTAGNIWCDAAGVASRRYIMQMRSSWPGLSRPSTSWGTKKVVDARAFAAPKGLRPRRRVKPGHDGEKPDVPPPRDPDRPDRDPDVVAAVRPDR